MKITKISAYQIDLPMKEGAYSWGDQSHPAFGTTVVLVETDAGITGAGRVARSAPAICPPIPKACARACSGLLRICSAPIPESRMRSTRLWTGR